MNKQISNLNITDLLDIVDVRDGLNPAIRKLIFAWNSAHQDDRFRNSSRLLKEIIGISEDSFEEIYYLLVDTTLPRVDLPFVCGRGIFGFPPAHPDFSEMKLSDFGRTIVERGNPGNLNLPFTLPIPYSLVGGTLGYSMSNTKIPTHNLAEVIDAMIALIKHPQLETVDLLKYIKGPDLLFGGAIENYEELCSIYESGVGNIKIIVTSQNFNWLRFEAVSDYCNWYELKFRKVYKKEAYRIEVPYYAFMNDGKNTKLMSLKNILENHLKYYRAYKSELDDDELCEMLTSLKENSTVRKTHEKFSEQL